jgi:hypothetical protein
MTTFKMVSVVPKEHGIEKEFPFLCLSYDVFSCVLYVNKQVFLLYSKKYKQVKISKIPKYVYKLEEEDIYTKW